MKTNDSSKLDVFGPVGAGAWYPAQQKELTNMVDSFLENAHVEESIGRIVAAIAPHAGFIYSGQCAAYSFKLLEGSEVERVIVLAPSHSGSFRGLSIMKADHYATPLGSIEVDIEACDQLLQHDLINTAPYVHSQEHSIENLMPFIQRTLKQFCIVPIIVGTLRKGDYSSLADALRILLDSRSMIAVSSDFTHYGYQFSYLPFPVNDDTRQNIEKLDGGAIEKIVNLDVDGYERYIEKTGATICGRTPISLLLRILSKTAKGKLVHYYTSGDNTGDFSHCVSYAAIVFYE